MKSVIITGAAGNLGLAVTDCFLKHEFKVAACISPRDADFALNNSNATIYPLDLTNMEDCKKCSEEIISKYKTIDAAVLTVGAFATGTMETVTKNDFDKMFALNFMTAFNIAQPVYLQMKKQHFGGKIILIGSGPGEDGSKAAGSVAYGFSKSLLFRLAELINSEGVQFNISAQVIIPTTIDTPQNRLAMPTADFSKWMTPESLANEIYLKVE